jgi:hypothetical protein
LQGPLLQIDVTEIIVHEAYEPNAVVDFLDAELLAGRDGRDVDLFPAQADAPQAVTGMLRSCRGILEFARIAHRPRAPLRIGD